MTVVFDSVDGVTPGLECDICISGISSNVGIQQTSASSCTSAVTCKLIVQSF